ncbi:DUF2938 domain-containing protein [Agarivorans sp. QJM3NY_25]|uniref:DUF2938 domain-containing protein n=1 Tax=Agarivorans sp. QJM3NY_25 TaxID=3421430 RepID=UPI003D7E2B5E
MLTNLCLQAVWIGIGATLVMDGWSLFQKRILGIPALDYALLARWVCFIPRGRLLHRTIVSTPPIKGERLLGWALHYAIGIVFAMAHVFLFEEVWLVSPTLLPALITGIVTLVFPFCIIQPCLGFGFAASKTAAPRLARGLSIVTHSAYGIGLFCSALTLP